jgi:WD40 repeat protein
VWEQRGRSVDRLWTGTAVKEFQIWRERYPGGLTATEAAFATAMVRLAERRRRRRRFAVAAGFAVVVVVMAVFAALWQRSVAETRRAEAGKLLALGQLEIERYPTLAVAYALKSLELSDTLEARLFALQALQKGPTALILPMSEETGGAHILRFSPDGRWVAMGDFDGVHVHPREEGAPFRVCRYPSSSGRGVVIPSFSPGGEHLAAIKSGEARFWSVPKFKEIGRAKNEVGPTGLLVTDDGFSSTTRVGDELVFRRWSFDGANSQVSGRMESFGGGFDIDRTGRWLAFGNGQRVFLRSLKDWERRPKLIGEHPADVRYVTFHPDRVHLATSDVSNEIRLWSLDPVSKAPTRILDGKRVGQLRFDGTGNWLAASGWPDGHPTVRLWNLKRSVEAEPIVLKSQDSTFSFGATFDPNNQWLVTANVGSVAFWPVEERLPFTLTGHGGMIESVVFTPDGKHVVSASGQDGTVRIWPLESGDPSRVILQEDMVFPRLAMDPAGKFVVVTGRTDVFVAPLDGGTSRKLEGFSAASYYLCVALDPEGRLVAAAPQAGPVSDKVIRIWDLESRESWTLGPLESAGDGGQGGFVTLSFLPGGQIISSGSGGLHLWSLENGHLRTLSPDPGFGVASRDGRFVLLSESLTGSVPSLVRYDMETGIKQALSSHGIDFDRIWSDPSGRFLLSAASDGMLRVGSATGEEPHLLFSHEAYVRSAVVSPDARWIASAGDDGKIRLWPMLEGTPFHTLPYEELLDRLRTVTNVRVVEDEASSTGYRVDYAPFPGWEKVPEWR